MWIRIASKGYVFGYIYESLFKYYFHENNVTSTKDKTMKVKIWSYTFRKHKDLYEKYNYVHVGFLSLELCIF